MLRIKRTKQGPPTAQVKDGRRVEVPGPVAVHYATAVTPRGTIEGWDRDPAKAVAVTEGVAKRVAEYHRGRKNVGELTYEATTVSAARLAEAVAAEDAVGAEEFAKLQVECRRLQAEAAKMRELAERAGLAANAATELEQTATRRAHELEASLAEVSGRAAAATGRAADLEAALAVEVQNAAALQARVAELEQSLAAALDAATKPQPTKKK